MTTPIKRATFQVESDWHLEHQGGKYDAWDKDFPARGDFLLLAGDCGAVRPGHLNKYEAVLTRLAPKYKGIFLVAGNNEVKGRDTFKASMAKLEGMENNTPTLLVLNHHSYAVPGYGITVMGCTLWSCIRADAGAGSGDAAAWPGETDEEHNKRYAASLQWLQKEVTWVRSLRPNDRIIILTHHAPTIRGSARPELEYTGGPTHGLTFSGYQNDILGGSGIEGLREGDHWVFGHTHFACSFKQDEVQCTANQRGGPKNDTRLSKTLYKKGQAFITV